VSSSSFASALETFSFACCTPVSAARRSLNFASAFSSATRADSSELWAVMISSARGPATS
jgi:hypothetical protein